MATLLGKQTQTSIDKLVIKDESIIEFNDFKIRGKELKVCLEYLLKEVIKKKPEEFI